MANQPNVREWADALESGRYAQGKKYLSRSTWLGFRSRGYCCLGVACELALAHGISINVAQEKQWRTYDGQSHYLPVSVQQWLGIVGGDPQLDFGDYRINAAYANDSGRTFMDIATAIRRTWL